MKTQSGLPTYYILMENDQIIGCIGLITSDFMACCDLWLSQIIENDRELTVIDWTSACRLPICLEIMYSFVTTAPECASGEIQYDRLKRYIGHYSKHFSLNEYDIKMLPYVFYHQQIMCHYPPPYGGVPDTYKPICALINKFTYWLHENVDILSAKLCTE